MIPDQIYTVSDAVAVINQTLEYAYPTITIIGEVAEYKVSGGKWVFFNIKDDDMSLKCFAVAWQMRTPIKDGIKVQIIAKPRLGKYGFSLNIDAVKPVGEGSIKKAFEMLRRKLESEGLFAVERKRPLPTLPSSIGVISSTGAAGYKDFIKILGERCGGIRIVVADTAVQGDDAPDQIIRALKYFNESENPPQVIAILRGGGSRDDLVAFDDERLVRAIAGSRVPTIVGVGHEVDVTLADLASDVRASTPSNVAEILVPDRREIVDSTVTRLQYAISQYLANLQRLEDKILGDRDSMLQKTNLILEDVDRRVEHLSETLRRLDPKKVLQYGYSIVRNKNGKVLNKQPKVGDGVCIENKYAKFIATVTKVAEENL